MSNQRLIYILKKYEEIPIIKHMLYHYEFKRLNINYFESFSDRIYDNIFDDNLISKKKARYGRQSVIEEISKKYDGWCEYNHIYVSSKLDEKSCVATLVHEFVHYLRYAPRKRNTAYNIFKEEFIADLAYHEFLNNFKKNPHLNYDEIANNLSTNDNFEINDNMKEMIKKCAGEFHNSKSFLNGEMTRKIKWK